MQCSQGKHKEETCNPVEQYTKITRTEQIKAFMCTVHQQWIYLFPRKLYIEVTWSDNSVESQIIE